MAATAGATASLPRSRGSIRRIANSDAIASEFGRDAADRALIVAASMLRNAITDIDMAARVGEHDFAVLLEGPTTTGKALSCTQQVVAAGLRSAPALPSGTPLKFHVAVALLPDKDLDAAGSLQWLVDGVAAIPADARNF